MDGNEVEGWGTTGLLMRGTVFLPVAAMIGAGILAFSADAAEGRIPVPTSKPDAAGKVGSLATGELSTILGADLKSGLDALSDRQPEKAIAVRERMPAGTLDRLS